MSTFFVYGVGASLLVAIGIHGAFTHRHLIRLILALNVMSCGVFLFLIAVAFRNRTPLPDPVPQALVLTGIVVAVSVSAVAVALTRHIHHRTGRTTLVEEDLE